MAGQKTSYLSWVLQIIVALILLQTLYFKFTGAEESVHIFTELGMEPWGRIGSGFAELMASILIVLPATATLGALLSAGIIAGAILSHLTILGIEVGNDGGFLFFLAMVVLIGSMGILWLRRKEIPVIGARF